MKKAIHLYTTVSVLLMFVMSSCSMQKCRYSSGFRIDWNNSQKTELPAIYHAKHAIKVQQFQKISEKQEIITTTMQSVPANVEYKATEPIISLKNKIVSKIDHSFQVKNEEMPIVKRDINKKLDIKNENATDGRIGGVITIVFAGFLLALAFIFYSFPAVFSMTVVLVFAIIGVISLLIGLHKLIFGD